MVSILRIENAFQLLYSKAYDRDFVKTKKLSEWGEAKLLPVVRTFLLGYFGHSVEPEFKVKLHGSVSGSGRIDFKIGDIAVEFAVRNKGKSKSQLSASVNASEVIKLLKYNGRSVLILYDFTDSPLDVEDIERFKEWDSLGSGNHKLSSFNVIYFSRDCLSGAGPIKKNIRIPRKIKN